MKMNTDGENKWVYSSLSWRMTGRSRLPPRQPDSKAPRGSEREFENLGRLESDNTSTRGFLENLNIHVKLLMSFAYISTLSQSSSPENHR
jgi:hypothetical protein